MATTTHTTSLFLLFVVSIFAVSHGNPYYYTPLPPPLSPSGTAVFPQFLLCPDIFTKCFGKHIICPQQCPSFKPSDGKSKGCFADCNSKKCEAVCKCMQNLP